MEIVLESVWKTVDNINLLSDISLKLKAGNIYGFVGYNGCGKTVLFKTIIGFMKQSSGNIYVDGFLRKDFLKDVGVIIERPNFIPYYDAFRNLKIIAAYDNKINDEQIRNVISMVGLDPQDKKKIKNYSLGMQQKLSIALALMENPSILILDEPLNAIDEASVCQIRKLIIEKKKEGKLILIASHYREDISTLCNVVYEMKEGRIVGETINE